MEACRETRDLFLQHTKGELLFRRRLMRTLQAGPCNVNVYQTISDHHILQDFQVPEEEGIRRELYQLFVKYCEEYLYHSDLVVVTDYIINMPNILNTQLYIKNVCMAMINYIYNLGFPIVRYLLSVNLNHRNGFYARFDNAIDHYVTVDLPYDPKTNQILYVIDRSVRRKKIPHHTFIIYDSGIVTQSGPNRVANEIAYNAFLSTVQEIRPLVEKGVCVWDVSSIRK